MLMEKAAGQKRVKGYKCLRMFVLFSVLHGKEFLF
jgi:hypothetical protein